MMTMIIRRWCRGAARAPHTAMTPHLDVAITITTIISNSNSNSNNVTARETILDTIIIIIIIVLIREVRLCLVAMAYRLDRLQLLMKMPMVLLIYTRVHRRDRHRAHQDTNIKNLSVTIIIITIITVT